MVDMTTMSTEAVLRLTVSALMSLSGEGQRALAAGIGQAQAQISRKQKGAAHWSLDDCDRLAAHYGMPALDLLAGPTHAATKLPEHRRMAVGSQTTIPVASAPTAVPAAEAAPATPADPGPAVTPQPQEPDRDAESNMIRSASAPCVLCGSPTPYRAAGQPQHLGGMCVTAEAPAAVQQLGADAVAPAAVERRPAAARRRPAQHAGAPLRERIRGAVEAEMTAHQGDMDAATAALIKRAIPDVMDLFDASRVGGRYEHSQFPPSAEILKKRSQKAADEIWEGRPKWRNAGFVKSAKAARDSVTVSGLDANAAYLSAMTTYLPIGALQHDTSGVHNTKKSGVHLIIPPEWDHKNLPSPLGNRLEPGPLWVGEPTLRLLMRCAREDLCEAPVIRESWVSGGTEALLKKLRETLRDARREAIENGDEATTEYVKAMYSKFVSTIGESSANRELRRPDWMHIIRAQAFANLWLKAKKAHDHGLTVVEISGTDELHLVGDWHTVFPEGRNLNEMKEKHTYTLGGK
jgi:hypothetical protein